MIPQINNPFYPRITDEQTEVQNVKVTYLLMVTQLVNRGGEIQNHVCVTAEPTYLSPNLQNSLPATT